jgi:hypothetical protein
MLKMCYHDPNAQHVQLCCSPYMSLREVSTPFSQNMFHYLATRGLGQFLWCPFFPYKPNPSRRILWHPPTLRMWKTWAHCRWGTYLRVHVVTDRPSYILAGYNPIWLPHYPSTYDLTKMRVWNRNSRSFEYSRMAGHSIFYLNREKILWRMNYYFIISVQALYPPPHHGWWYPNLHGLSFFFRD